MSGTGQRVILCVIGTRPEAIKMAPVIEAFQRASWSTCRVLVTAQHRELLDQMLDFFEIRPDADLDIMRSNQTLVDLTARVLVALDRVLSEEEPDMILAQGDTTTVMATALASFYRRIPFGHVEAGLRTHRLYSPFPEEANRVLTSHLASLHFAPTAGARDDLLREGISADIIHVTGNTVIDALLMTQPRHVPLGVSLDPEKRLILVTAHRRDSFGEPIRQICRAIATLSAQYEDVEFLWPVHPNPSVTRVVTELMADYERVHLCPPLPYGSFVSAMARSHLILTDSGGVAEEAPALGKPVLVMREHTERPEAMQAGVAKLIGMDGDRIVAETKELLDDPAVYARMSVGASPYGDGKAAGRIVEAVREFLQGSKSVKDHLSAQDNNVISQGLVA